MIYSVNLIWINITNQVPAIKAINVAPITGSSSSLNLYSFFRDNVVISYVTLKHSFRTHTSRESDTLSQHLRTFTWCSSSRVDSILAILCR